MWFLKAKNPPEIPQEIPKEILHWSSETPRGNSEIPSKSPQPGDCYLMRTIHLSGTRHKMDITSSLGVNEMNQAGGLGGKGPPKGVRGA